MTWSIAERAFHYVTGALKEVTWPGLRPKYEMSSFTHYGNSRGSKHLKREWCGPDHIPFGTIHLSLVDTYHDPIDPPTKSENLKRLASPIPEIEGGPKIKKVGPLIAGQFIFHCLILPLDNTIYLHTSYQK